MKKLAVAVLFCGASAFAGTVTYSTAAVLSGPDASGGGLANGGATITYTGVPLTSVNSPTNINIGSLTAAGGSGTFSGDKIALTITQTVPSAGTGSSSSTIDGSITSTSNGIDLTFAPTSFSIGSTNYVLLANYFLVAPNTNSGVTTLEASVVTSPEPASLGLIGASLLGLGLIARRRIAK